MFSVPRSAFGQLHPDTDVCRIMYNKFAAKDIKGGGNDSLGGSARFNFFPPLFPPPNAKEQNSEISGAPLPFFFIPKTKNLSEFWHWHTVDLTDKLITCDKVDQCSFSDLGGAQDQGL